MLRPLCYLKLHAWRTDELMIGPTYHHIDPENPAPKPGANEIPRKQSCSRCGKRRVWSFSKGRWRVIG